MTLPRPLARLMAVAIVLIAACVGASVVGVSSAQAHQGHAHQGHVHLDRAAHAPAATALTLAEARSLAQGPRLTAIDPDEAPAARPCNGLCCLMGASCCVPGLLPESLAALPGPPPAPPQTPPEDRGPAGRAPASPPPPPPSRPAAVKPPWPS